MAYEQHTRDAESISGRCAIITLSDTRTEQTDKSGARIRELLTEQGHTIAAYNLVRDDPIQLERTLSPLLASDEIDAVLTTGGTGISGRDQTITAIEKHLTLPLPGFGELFRMLSYQQIGSGAMLSRAIGGVAQRKLLFAMPGSTKAVELAMTKLILPELRHLLGEMRK